MMELVTSLLPAITENDKSGILLVVLMIGAFGYLIIKDIFSTKKIVNQTEKIIDYFQIDQANRDIIKKLNEIKDYYILQFTDINLKNATSEISDRFISVIGKLLEIDAFNIKYLCKIKYEFEINELFVKAKLKHYLGEDASAKYIAIHDKHYNEFVIETEDILTCMENHHKEKFLIASTDYLKSFLREINLPSLRGNEAIQTQRA